MRKKCTIISDQSGSSLIAVALFVTAMGLLTAAGLQTYRQYNHTHRMVETQEKLDTLRATLINYYAQNGRFPCPASLVAAPNSGNFGREALNPCNTTSGGGGGGWGWGNGSWGYYEQGYGHSGPSGHYGGWSEDVNIDTTGTVRATGDTGKKIRIGALPTRALNLPDTDSIDGYGHRIIYAVVEQMTLANAASVTNPGAIEIEDRNGNNASKDRAMVVLYSQGGDEAGAWDINGTPIRPCDDNTLGGDNCDYDGDFVNTLNKSDRSGNAYFTHRLVYIGPDIAGKN